MFYNRLVNNMFLRLEANPDGGDGGNGGGAAAPPTDTPPAESAAPTTPSNPYDFGDESEPGGTDDANAQPPTTEEKVAYEIEWGEEFIENDALRDMLKGHAQASGLPAEAAGRFLQEVTASIRADEEEAFRVSDEALRGEWGSSYESNVAVSKAFAQKIAKVSGLPMEKMDVFASPDGFRVLHALSQAMGESGLKGGGQGVKAMSSADEASAVLSDPNHRYYKAISDPSHPQWREATAYYNKLVGISG